jgi:ABC-type amino acid transport substrate-binding protein
VTYILLFLSLFLLHGPTSYASDSKTIRLGANAFIPPYVIAKSKSKPGILVEVAKEVIREMGYNVEVYLLSNQRIHLEFIDGNLDASVFLPAITKKEMKVYESREIIPFKNGFICLQIEKCNEVQKVDNKLTLVGFQNATKYVDQRYADMVKKHKGKYLEVADQRQQVLGLLSKDYDVVFMDYRIFQYHLNQIIDSSHPFAKQAKKIEAKQVLWDNQPKRKVAFKTKELADKFDSAFQKLQDTGRIKLILKRYGVEP